MGKHKKLYGIVMLSKAKYTLGGRQLIDLLYGSTNLFMGELLEIFKQLSTLRARETHTNPKC